MGLLLAYMANDSDRIACALHAARPLLHSKTQPHDSWGIGFYQGGEVLLQRRPKQNPLEVDFYEVCRPLRTDALLAHVRVGAPSSGKAKNENTHPFRFRSWLFAHHGRIENFEAVKEKLLDRTPDFLRRNIRGQTDSEHLFHLLLGELQEIGKLDDTAVTTESVRDAVRRTIASVGELSNSNTLGTLAIANGRILVATRGDRPVHVLRLQAIYDCPVCRDSAKPQTQLGKRIDHEHLRGVLLVADADPAMAARVHNLEPLGEGSFVSVSSTLNVEYEPIDVPLQFQPIS